MEKGRSARGSHSKDLHFFGGWVGATLGWVERCRPWQAGQIGGGQKHPSSVLAVPVTSKCNLRDWQEFLRARTACGLVT